MSQIKNEDENSLVVRISPTSSVTLKVQPVLFIWYVKILLYYEMDIPPEKQMLYLVRETKEMEVIIFSIYI